MDDPRDEALLARFAAVYRGRHDPSDALRWIDDPDAPAADGSPGPARRLRGLREAVFRPDADAGAVARLRAEEAAVAADRLESERSRAAARGRTEPTVAPPPAPRGEQEGPRQPRARRRWRTPAIALVVGLAVGAGAGAALRGAGPAPAPTEPPSVQESLRSAVIESAGRLAPLDYYRAYPDDLPLEWGSAITGTSFTHLSGTTYRSVDVSDLSSELLVVIACPTADTAFQWHLFTADLEIAQGSGRCGSMEGRRLVLGGRHASAVALRVDVQGGRQYAASVLQR